MKKRILSLVLCAAMLLSMCLFLGAGVTNSLTVCDSSGEAVKRVDLPVNQKISLTAQAQSAAGNDAYQWQIRAAKDVWANILGSDTQTLELSYPMVASALSEKNTVQIRCRLTSAETGEATFSDAVTVEVTAATAVDTPASADAAAAPVLRGPAKVAAAANDAPETCTIEIKYVFKNGTQAAPSWTATVAKGSSFNQTITSPTVVGYEPEPSYKSITIDETNIQNDITRTVYYYPAQVDFTVKYYQQNVNDDKYSLFETKTKQGYTEKPVSEYETGENGFAKNYDGFTRLLYDGTATIAADGSTVVELYYDRNYYLMNFDLDGGYGVEPIYARYDAPINVGNPTKPGYSFKEWTPELPTTMPVVPKDAQPYKATWEAGSADYLVQYWLENANDANYSYDTSVSRSAAVGSVINGSGDQSYTGFHFDHADQNVTVNGDGTSVVNVYYKRNTWTLRFADVRGALKCTKTEHSHSDSCCKYGGTSLTHWSHSNSCCKLGLSSHTHNDNCYYDYVEFKNIKYGEDTTKYWDQAPSGYLWYTTEDGNTFYTAAPDMPNKNLTIYGRSSSGRSSTIHYYEEGTTTSIKPDLKVQKTDWNFTSEDYIAIPGFTYKSNSENGSQYYLYYTRNSYKLDFNNKGKIVESKTISYDAALKSHYFVPAYPDGLEPNAYQFAGWYTDPGCTNAVDWDTAKMPYNNTVFYAKWAPVTHTVKTWLTDAKATPVNAPGTDSNVQTVNHRGLATKPVTPINGGYTFVGWFYKDANGTEHAFDFSMPVTKDLDLYAKWSSNTLMEYTIHYKLRNGDTTIAQDTKGSALAGSTKTFEAKTGDQLNEGYQSGYFPETSSHSIIMDIEGTAANGKNDFTFYYVQKEKVKYTVRYLEKGTNNVLHKEKTGETSAAVITEKFEQIKGYAPDAYQKRLVLSANDKENVLTFWYVEDKDHAPVQIIHWTQNIEGEGYTEYQSSTDLNGEIGKTYTAQQLTNLPGFEFNAGKSETSGKVEAGGLVLNLYYDRIKYPYAFQFLEQGTNKVLKDSVIGKARYQAQVTETAPSIPGYTLVGDRSQSMLIQIENPANEANKNVKIFYYTEQTVDIKYQVAGPDGFGTLDKVQDSNVKVLSGTVQGSTPTANEGYKFVGWFEDEDCTQSVNSSWVDANNKLTPLKNASGQFEAATYYAKFERDVFDLTIEKTGEKIDQNQTFVFRVQGEGVDMQVVITGTNTQVIKNLPVGDYTITEDTSWSWKYTPVDKDGAAAPSQTINATGATTVTFENKNNGTNWLTSLAKAINTWVGGNAHKKTN